MRRGRILIFLLLILIVFVAVAALLLPTLLKGMGIGAATPTPALARVAIAGQNIPLGTTITPNMLAYMTIPQENVTAAMYTSEQEGELVGKVARFTLEQGVVITRSMVAESAADLAESGPSWAKLIPPGMTAMAMPITRLGAAAYGVTDGARVNVTACMLLVDVDNSYQSVLPNHIGVLQGPANVEPSKMPGITLAETTGAEDPWYQGRVEVEPSFRQPWHIIPSEPQRPRLVCQLLWQDVEVMRLGNFEATAAEAPQPDAAPQPTPVPQPVAPGENAQTEPRPPDIITLILTPQDSVTLAYMIYSGAKLNLALRNTTDRTRVATEAATLQFILTQYNIPVPAKLPYAVEPRLDSLTEPFMPNDIIVVPAE